MIVVGVGVVGNRLDSVIRYNSVEWFQESQKGFYSRVAGSFNQVARLGDIRAEKHADRATGTSLGKQSQCGVSGFESAFPLLFRSTIIMTMNNT